jgi:hypothetical protein
MSILIKTQPLRLLPKRTRATQTKRKSNKERNNLVEDESMNAREAEK